MRKRLKEAIVESYVGAIALGYLLAQTILHLVNIFASPVSVWVTQKLFKDAIPHPPPGFSLYDSLPDLVRFLLLLLFWYLLLRWLYMKPSRGETSESAPESS